MVNQSKRNTFDTSCLSASNLRILLAIATSKSFSGASDKLNLTQPAISRSMCRLEENIGHSIFTSKNHPVQLSPIGRMLCKQAESLLDELDEIYSEVKIQTQDANNCLRLASSTSLTQTTIPYVVEALYQGTSSIAAYNGNTPKVCQMLLEGKVDISLASDPMSTYKSIMALPLYKERYLAVLPKCYDGIIRSKLDLIRLSKTLPCLQFNDTSYDVVHTSRVLRQWGIQNTLMLGTWTTLKMIEKGLAWALMPVLNILPAKDFVHSISFLYASEQQGMRTAYVLYKTPAYEQLAKKIAGLVVETLKTKILPQVKNPLLVDSVKLFDVSDN